QCPGTARTDELVQLSHADPGVRDLLAGQGDLTGRALVPTRGGGREDRHRDAGARQPDRMGQRDPVWPVRPGPLPGAIGRSGVVIDDLQYNRFWKHAELRHDARMQAVVQMGGLRAVYLRVAYAKDGAGRTHTGGDRHAPLLDRPS